jgi:hypothetical protein
VTDLKALAERAKRLSVHSGDYWDRSADFLIESVDRPMAKMTLKQRNWLSQLKQELRNPWD